MASVLWSIRWRPGRHRNHMAGLGTHMAMWLLWSNLSDHMPHFPAIATASLKRLLGNSLSTLLIAFPDAWQLLKILQGTCHGRLKLRIGGSWKGWSSVYKPRVPMNADGGYSQVPDRGEEEVRLFWISVHYWRLSNVNKTIKDGDIAPWTIWKDLNKKKGKEKNKGKEQNKEIEQDYISKWGGSSRICLFLSAFAPAVLSLCVCWMYC